MTYSSKSRLYLLLCLLVLTAAAGCAHEPLKGIENWQDTNPPTFSFKGKAEVYQERPLYPLLLLEDDEGILRELRKGARRTWSRVSEDHNAFFSFVHAAVVEDGEEGKTRGRKGICEFPDSKVVLVLVTHTPEQNLTEATPLYERHRTASLWVSDPRELAGQLIDMGNVEFAGIDYLIAYWMGQYHGFILPEE